MPLRSEIAGRQPSAASRQVRSHAYDLTFSEALTSRAVGSSGLIAGPLSTVPSGAKCALAAALLFEFGKLAIGFYIGKQGLESSFGAAASLVVVLIWVYYSAQIVLMGAEFTRAHALHRGAQQGRRKETGEPPADRLAIHWRNCADALRVRQSQYGRAGLAIISQKMPRTAPNAGKPKANHQRNS